MKLKKSTKKALKWSIFSALTIGLVHYIAHQIFTTGNFVMKVGTTVVISVFLISLFGMKWKDWFVN